jgi:hypothetical protein
MFRAVPAVTANPTAIMQEDFYVRTKRRVYATKQERRKTAVATRQTKSRAHWQSKRKDRVVSVAPVQESPSILRARELTLYFAEIERAKARLAATTPTGRTDSTGGQASC